MPHPTISGPPGTTILSGCPTLALFLAEGGSFQTPHTSKLVWATQPENDRGRESVSSPSLRTGQADFPHPALQLVILPRRGLTNRIVGCD